LFRGELVRIYNPARHATSFETFRFFGPRLRFDHQRPTASGDPRDDLDRGSWYGAPDDQSRGHDPLEVCAFEVFGADRVLLLHPHRLGRVRPTRTLALLDIRATADEGDVPALGAGVPAQLPNAQDARMCQAWSRWWYEHDAELGQRIDGLIWSSAWTGGDVVWLYERCRGELAPVGTGSAPLTRSTLKNALLEIAARYEWELAAGSA
jgi:hypothetical protein